MRGGKASGISCAAARPFCRSSDFILQNHQKIRKLPAELQQTDENARGILTMPHKMRFNKDTHIFTV